MSSIRFDWYSATVDGVRGSAVVTDLMELFGSGGHPSVEATPHKRLNHYDNATAIRDAQGQLCIVRWGGNGGGVSVEANGPTAVPVSSWLRSDHPAHRVTRMDACIDRDAPRLFDRMAAQLLTIADEHRVKVDHQGDWHRAQDGRTLYLGGKQSEKRLRCYEKGIQLAAEGHPQASPTLVRLEAVVRPDERAAKERAASLTPLECFGCSPWLVAALDRFAGLGAPEIELRRHTKSTLDRAFGFMCQQYRRAIEHRLQLAGADPAEFVADVLSEFRAQDEAKALLRRSA